MNERIEKLAEQCYHRYSEHNINLEKFAELIVRECISQVDKSNYNSGDEWDKAMACAANNIREHFGVED